MNNQIYTLLIKIYPFIMLGLTVILIYYLYSKRDYIFKKGFKLIREGQYKMALDEFIKNSTNKTNTASIYYGIAYCYFMLGYNNNAIKNYEKAIKLNQNLGEVYLQLALLFSKRKNFKKAFNIIEQLKIQQKKFIFFNRIKKYQINEIVGWIYYEKGEIDYSLKHYNFSIPRFKIFFKTNFFRYLEKFSPIYYRIGIIYKLKKEIKKAKECFKNSIKSSPNSIFAQESKDELEKLEKKPKTKLPFSDII